MFLLVCVLIGFFQAAVTCPPKDRINLTIAYQAGCPFSLSFFLENVIPKFPHVREIINLELLPFVHHYPTYTGPLQIQHANTQATPRQALENKENIAFSLDRKKSLTIQDVSHIQKRKAPQLPSVAQNFGKITPQVNPQSTKPINKSVQNIAQISNTILPTPSTWNTNLTIDPLQKNVGQSNIIIPSNHKISLPKTEVSEMKENAEKLKIISPTVHRTSQLENESTQDRLLFGPKKVTRNISMLQELMQALNISKLDIPMDQIYFKTVLDEDSKQYKFAKSHFRNKKFINTYKIKQIEQIWNPYLFLQYKIMRDKFSNHLNRQILFHGTSMENLDSILTYNFDWRKVKDGMYGWGAYFANNPWYASHFSVKQHDKGKYYVMILAKVLIGLINYGDYTTFVPVTGDTTKNRDGQVLVKYDDACFYPEFIIYFEKSTTDSQSFSSISTNDLTLTASVTGSNEIKKFGGETEAKDCNAASKNTGAKLIKRTSGVKKTIKNTGPVKPKNLADLREPLSLVESAEVILSPRQFMMPLRPNGLIRPRGLGIPIRPTGSRRFRQPNVSVVRSRAFMSFGSSWHRPRRF